MGWKEKENYYDIYIFWILLQFARATKRFIRCSDFYNLVVEAYDPVQEAAGVLMNILIKKSDLYDAERYAQVTYSTLRDKKNGIDQESEAVAEGAYNLADVIYKQKGDLIKAEELIRESLRIGSLIYDSNHQRVGRSCVL
jgi:hypothetical protein